MADLTLKGSAEIKQRLRELPDKMIKNILRGALRQAANVVKDAARENVPVDTGALKSSIRVVSRRGSPTRVRFNVVAGALSDTQIERFDRKLKTDTRQPFYALFVERGTVKMPARPFMRTALESKAQEAIDVLVEQVSARMPETVK